MKTTIKYCTLLHLLAAMLFVASCERHDILQETQSGPKLQGAQGNGETQGDTDDRRGGGPCQCGPDCSALGVSRSLDPDTADHDDVIWDFVVSLRMTDDCNPSLIDPSTCHFTGKRYQLSFPNNPDFLNYINLSFFTKIHAYDPNDSLIQIYDGPDESSLFVADEADIYFKWDSDHFHHATPSEGDLVGGGVCIIGILTDPCPICHQHAIRRPPLAPHKLRLN